MKKFVIVICMLVCAFGTVSAFAQDPKVVVIPLNSTSKVSFETVSHQYSIPGTSFLPIRGYGMTEAAGWEVTYVNPGIYVLGSPPYGAAHNKDGELMSFTSPVHLPDGASIGHIGAAICGNETVTDHDIEIELIATDMTSGDTEQTVIRSFNITSPDCGTSHGGSGLMLAQWVDNSKYTYQFRVRGIEGGTCDNLGLSWKCDERRTRIQFAHINYSTSEIVNP